MPSKLIASFRSPALWRERAAMFDQREKIVLFIDGANLFAAAKALGFDIDYRKLLEAFRKRAYLLRANYYCALVEDQETATIRPPTGSTTTDTRW